MKALRTCPKCNIPMDINRFNELEIDSCRSCGGTFLDSGEETELLGLFAAPETWRASGVAERIDTCALNCPHDAAMLSAYSVRYGNNGVEVDLCPECSGLWLDAKEGRKLRNIVMSAGQTKKSDLSPNAGVGSYLFQLISGFPKEVWNPVHKTPKVTISLILAFNIVFLLQLLLVRMMGPGAFINFYSRLALVPAEVVHNGHFWTLLTSVFLHGGIYHVLGNSYFLYIFGDNVEVHLGREKYFQIFLIAALTGSIFQTIVDWNSYTPVIGASGGVAGLMGAYLVMFSKVRLYVVLFFIRFRLNVTFYLVLWLLFNILMASLGAEHVAWMAHIGGFIAGVTLAYLHSRRVALLEL